MKSVKARCFPEPRRPIEYQRNQGSAGLHELSKFQWGGPSLPFLQALTSRWNTQKKNYRLGPQIAGWIPRAESCEDPHTRIIAPDVISNHPSSKFIRDMAMSGCSGTSRPRGTNVTSPFADSFPLFQGFHSLPKWLPPTICRRSGGQ